MDTMCRRGRLQRTGNLLSVLAVVVISSSHSKSLLPPINSFTVGVTELDLIHGISTDSNSHEVKPRGTSRKMRKYFDKRNHQLSSSSSSSLTTSLEGDWPKENTVLQNGRKMFTNGDAHVRRNRNVIENLSERSQTGLVDPKRFDLVEYDDNHPMKRWADRHRRLVQQHNGDLHAAHAAAAATLETDDNENLDTEYDYDRELSTSTNSNSTSSSIFQPLRISFNTDALDTQNDGTNTAKINFIKTQLLPRAAAFWSQTLSVVPVQGYLQINPSDLVNGQYCGDTEFSMVPSEEMSPGILNTDLRLYVSASNSTTYCGPNTLAVAVACNFDGYDRPVAGAVNICINQIDGVNSDGSFNQNMLANNLVVIQHEMGHVLAVSSNHFRFYRKADGEPRTSRPFQQANVLCSDGVERPEYLPDTNVVDWYYDALGSRYAAITTERVTAVARNQFDCQEIPGGRLENQQGDGSCFGDHWEERLYYDEVMSGVIAQDDNFLSPITVALCEDSGWYLANYSTTTIMPWGHSAGCSFYNNSCVATDSGGNSYVPDYARGYFCTSSAQRGCGPAHTHKMACTLMDYDLNTQYPPPPNVYQYFRSQPSDGGLNMANYCPIFGSTYKGLSADELDCRNPDNQEFVNLYGEYWGPNSMCFESLVDSYGQLTYGTGRCYKAQCDLSSRKLHVYIRGSWMTCDYDFQQLSIVSNTGVFEGKVTCPRLAQVCPGMFCPANCAGRGVCNFKAIKSNGTYIPKCECFNSSDTSEGCSSSLVLSGQYDSRYIGNSGGLQDVHGSNGFFGPFISVFVDKPGAWNRASWIWFASIVMLFMALTVCICSAFLPSTMNKRSPQQLKGKVAGKKNIQAQQFQRKI